MLKKNMGQTDRTIRAIGGVVLIIAFFTMSGFWAWLAGIVGVALIATAALGTCPPYNLLGINTCSSRET